jgi:hypothetical protein
LTDTEREGRPPGLFSRACALEDAGDPSGAWDLLLAGLSQSQRFALYWRFRRLQRRLASPATRAALARAGDVTREIRLARTLAPGSEVRRVWDAIATMTPRELDQWSNHRIRPPKRGRPAGKGPSAVEAARHARMRELIFGPMAMQRTTAARRVLADDGVRGDLRGRASALVRRFDRANKSG